MSNDRTQRETGEYTVQDALNDLDILDAGINSVSYLNYPMNEIWEARERLREFLKQKKGAVS